MLQLLIVLAVKIEDTKYFFHNINSLFIIGFKFTENGQDKVSRTMALFGDSSRSFYPSYNKENSKQCSNSATFPVLLFKDSTKVIFSMKQVVN